MVRSYSCVDGWGRRVSGRTQDSGPRCVRADTSARLKAATRHMPVNRRDGRLARARLRATAEPRVYPRTSGVSPSLRRREPRTLFSADVMAAHDLQEAGVIGKAQRLRRPRDVPVVVLQGCDDDLALRLRLE